MIISASYRTDIPAFYGDWFMNRLRAGYCLSANPYSRRTQRLSLTPEDLDGFVFWTKNLKPFLPHLEEVRARGFPFVVLYSIENYPRQLEAGVIPAAESVELMRRLAWEFGPRAGVWRYDPVLFTSVTDAGFHRENFAALARQLEGATDEVVISFAQIYRKTRRNLDRAAERHGFSWHDPEEDIKRKLLADLADIAKARGMQLSICAQRHFLTPGVADARCVDATRLGDVAGRLIPARGQGHRQDCGCHPSRDIGAYDTCPHGCVYCYAVRRRELARQRYQQHDPEGEFLFPPGGGV